MNSAAVMDRAQTGQKRTRYHLLDSLRGLNLLSMIIYHAVWDLVYIFGMEWKWFYGTAAYVWQQMVCWTFILLSGFCWSMSKRPLKRGMVVLTASFLLSLVTIAAVPQQKVLFGVLTLLGSSMIIMTAADKLFIKVKPVYGFIVFSLLFILTRNVSDGIISFGKITLFSLPPEWYKNFFTAFLGLPFSGFWSTDYFPLVPWFFLFSAGYFIHKSVKDKLGIIAHCKGCGFLNFMGKHSLVIYLIHQPVIYGIFTLLL
ncbi:MAG: DUF1624 domain-containing protein [Oscillospiraceae bacterium]|nr:DUF1624 domain-containing protein [Oscillospiraceae bacterium]